MKKKTEQALKKVPASKPFVTVVKKHDPVLAIKKAALLFITLLLIHLAFNLIRNFSKDYNIFDRDWGFNNISYFSPFSFALFYIICIAICIPVVNKTIISLISRIVDFLHLQKLKKIRWLLFLIVSALSILVFYFLRIKYDLLGDMDLRIPQTVKKEYIFTEYLTMYVLHYLDVFLHDHFKFPPHESFTLHSFLCGVSFVFFLFLTADALGKGLFQKSVIFLFSVFFGTMLIFFGYVEIYSIPALSVLVYIYFIILCLQSKVHIIFPAIALLLSLGFHLMNVGLIPSFFLLITQKYFSSATWFKKVKAKHIIILILCGLPFMYVLAPMADLGYYLTVLKPTPSQPKVMTLFSFVHFWEFFNAQLLASGTGFFLILYLTFKAIRGKIIIPPMVWLLSSAAFFMFVIAFVSHLVRGSGDWDIMSFPSIIYNILGIYWLLIAYNNKQQFLKYVVLVLILIHV